MAVNWLFSCLFGCVYFHIGLRFSLCHCYIMVRSGVLRVCEKVCRALLAL